MSRTDYSLVLPAYTIGSHAYDKYHENPQNTSAKKSSSSAAKQPLKKQSNRS